ncbi:MAG: glutamate 5-kinase, partial [Polyangiaceae bacterium]|nr:glutamate 5-kinase [Polyangiaceae bacterium]
VLAGDDAGTLFAAVPQRLSARKHWIAHTLRPRGAVVVDRGAADAICARNRSILPVGVLGVRGTFQPGDAVAIVDPEGRDIARGLVRFSASDAARIAGKKRDETGGDEVIVHRDDLVVLPSE